MHFRKLAILFTLVSLASLLMACSVQAYTSYSDMIQEMLKAEKMEKPAGSPTIKIYSIGNSVENRQIPLALLRDSSVPILQTRKLFIICRQHGNEPASTEAALDLIQQVSSGTDNSWCTILKKVTLFIIPMANPDGAVRFRRRNAHNVDLNRDWMAQTQPETQAILNAVKIYRPDAIIDAHELAPGNRREDFVEAVSQRAGAAASVATLNKTLQDIVLETLQTYGQAPNRIESQTPRKPTLAHRYFSVVMGIPAVLFETKQAGSRSQDLTTRRDIHEVGMIAIARSLAGDDNTEIAKMLTDHAQHITSGEFQPTSRMMAQLPSRGGKTKRWNSRTRTQSRTKTKATSKKK